MVHGTGFNDCGKKGRGERVVTSVVFHPKNVWWKFLQKESKRQKVIFQKKKNLLNRRDREYISLCLKKKNNNNNKNLDVIHIRDFNPISNDMKCLVSIKNDQKNYNNKCFAVTQETIKFLFISISVCNCLKRTSTEYPVFQYNLHSADDEMLERLILWTFSSKNC